MKILNSLFILSLLVVLSACRSNLDIHLLSQKVIDDKFFLNTAATYNLNNYSLDVPLIKESAQNKHPSAILSCTFNKDSDPTDYPCSDLNPQLNINNARHFTWTTTHAENGQYSFKIAVSFDGKIETKDLLVNVNNANRSPVIDILTNQIVNEDEAISTISPVSNDPDGETLSFVCLYTQGVLVDQDCADLGVVFSSIDGTLDWTPSYPQKGDYHFKIRASDGTLSAEQGFTINVIGKSPFITEWRTTTPNETIILPLHSSFAYNFTVNWGDGSAIETVTSSSAQHTYASSGLHTVTIRGVVSGINFDQAHLSADKDKIVRVIDLGDVGWKNLKNAFYSATNLTSVKGGETSQVTDMSGMFVGTRNLIELDVSTYDTSSVTDMSNMFSGAEKLTSLDLSNFDTSNVLTMSGMFNYCLLLNSLDVSGFNTSKVQMMDGMFANLRALPSLNVSSFDTSKVLSMDSMFMNMRTITTLNLANFETPIVNSMISMFEGTYELTSLNISNFNTENVISFSYMFSGARKLATLNLSHFQVEGVRDMSSMFKNMYSLTTLDLTSFHTNSVRDMREMFYGDSALTTLLIPNFNTSQVTAMDSMFGGVSSLTTLNLSSFNTSNVQSINGMFMGMSSLTSLNIRHFNTVKVTNMAAAFNGLNLAQLDLSTLDTSKVTNVAIIFANSNITKLLLHGQTTADAGKSSWDLSLVTVSNDAFLDSSIGAYCYGNIVGRACDFDPTTF